VYSCTTKDAQVDVGKIFHTNPISPHKKTKISDHFLTGNIGLPATPYLQVVRPSRILDQKIASKSVNIDDFTSKHNVLSVR